MVSAGGAGPGGDAPALTPIGELIAQHGIRPRRALGQHFLLDPNLCARIARAAAPDTQAAVLEIGPGPGGLTRALLAAGARRVVAIEKDRRCIAALSELAARFPDRLTIIEEDALTIDLAAIDPARIKIVANLPYNIGTKLLLRWLDQIDQVESMTLMFQREVARRITATEGRDYGRLSVRAQWVCRCEKLFDITPKAFTPPPAVVSTVVGLTPRAEPLAPADLGALEAVTRAAFGQRRKMLRRALATLTNEPEVLLDAAGLSGEMRAEALSVEDFCALARAWSASRTANGR